MSAVATYVNQPIRVSIQALNAAGALVTLGGSNFAVHFRAPAATTDIVVPARDLANGTYVAETVATIPGTWTVASDLTPSGGPAALVRSTTVLVGNGRTCSLRLQRRRRRRWREVLSR